MVLVTELGEFRHTTGVMLQPTSTPPLFLCLLLFVSVYLGHLSLLGLTAFLFPRTAIAVLPSLYCSLLYCTYI